MSKLEKLCGNLKIKFESDSRFSYVDANYGLGETAPVVGDSGAPVTIDGIPVGIVSIGEVDTTAKKVKSVIYHLMAPENNKLWNEAVSKGATGLEAFIF